MFQLGMTMVQHYAVPDYEPGYVAMGTHCWLLARDLLNLIAFFQLWCQVATLQNQRQTLLGDNHSPDPIRYVP